MLMTETQGYYYPASFQASTVAETLIGKIKTLPIQVETGFEAETADKKKDTFRVYGNGVRYEGKIWYLLPADAHRRNWAATEAVIVLPKDFTTE